MGDPSRVPRSSRSGKDYTASQTLRHALRRDGSDGIVYPSVRYAGGDCFAAFWPDIVTIPVPGRHLCYYWSGDAIRYVKNLETGTVFDTIDER